MDTVSREAVETFIGKNARRHALGQKVDRETARARAEEVREEAALARHALLAGGIDPERLDALAAARSRRRRELAERAHDRAIQASPKIAKLLSELTPALPPADPTQVIIDEVTFIRSFADAGAVYDSNIESLNSWARYEVDGSGGAVGEAGTGRLSFYTLWQNPRRESVVVAAGARLVANASLSVDADFNGVAAWFIEGSKASANVRARTTVWAIWDSTVSAIVQETVLANAVATGGFFGGDDSASIAFNDFLPASGFFVPAQAYILIEVELRTEWLATNGSIKLDAQSGSFQISVPHLILTLT